MSDIVDRLRRWTHAVDAAPASDLMDKAADEIERLRQKSNQTGCDCRPATLTDAEREAIAELTDDPDFYGLTRTHAKVLRGLLERPK